MNTRLTLTLCAAVLLATGCQTAVNTTELAEPNGRREFVADKRLVTDSSLNRKVNIRAVNQAVDVGGLVKVQVELANLTYSVQSFSYQFEWFDDKGMLVSGPATVFVPRQIEGRESIFISATAPGERAKDFRLKLIATK